MRTRARKWPRRASGELSMPAKARAWGKEGGREGGKEGYRNE